MSQLDSILYIVLVSVYIYMGQGWRPRAAGRGGRPHQPLLLLLLLLLLALAMAPNVLVGRDVMIPASTWDMEPPQPEGWPGKVTEYNTGGSSMVVGQVRSMGGR